MIDKCKAAIYNGRMPLHRLIDTDNLISAAESAARVSGAVVSLFALDLAIPSPVEPGAPMLFFPNGKPREDDESKLDFHWKAALVCEAESQCACDGFVFRSSRIMLYDNGRKYPKASITIAIPKSTATDCGLSPVCEMIDHICRSVSSELSAQYALQCAIARAEAVEEELSAEKELKKRAEMLEMENRRAIETVKQKNQFLACVSHDLKTPLTSIIGFTEILLEESEGELASRQKDMLQRVSRNAARLLKMINDLLDLSKLESGRMDLRLSKVRLSVITDHVIHTMIPLVKGRNLTISVELAEDLPLLYTDEQKLTQIIINLVSNAVKFTPEGRVTIKARSCEDKVIIAVSDTGIGISQSDFEAIFEEFRQVGGQKPSNGGTGLGLAITGRLVKILGGEIGVCSELGSGSTFTVKLPLSLNQPDC